MSAEQHLHCLPHTLVSASGKLARHDGTESGVPCPYVRLSFVVSKEEEIPVAIERLAGLLQRHQGGEKHGGEKHRPHVIATDGRPPAQEETL